MSAPSTTRLVLFFWFSMSHFLPSRANTGGFSTGGVDNIDAFGRLITAGAGPLILMLGFLWVCKSGVIFFKPLK